MQSSMVTYNFGTTNSDWSLGFEESSPGVWKVNRISPTACPQRIARPSRARAVPGPGVNTTGGGATIKNTDAEAAGLARALRAQRSPGWALALRSGYSRT